MAKVIIQKKGKTEFKLAMASQIRNIRLARGLTQAKIADTLGCSVVTVSLWETGVTMPDSQYWEKLCLALDAELVLVQK